MRSDRVPGAPTDVLVELGRFVLGDQPLGVILDRVVGLAQQAVGPDLEVSITLVAGSEPSTAAFTGDVACLLDERQYESERGPCLDAAASGQLISIPDMTTESRWSRFTQAAVAHGVLSSLSVPLPVQEHVTGALNFYATARQAFDVDAQALAETFAAHAAVAVANAQTYESTAALAEQMKQAMATRAVIEQAKGIIMRENRCPPDEAFDLLVRLSQESHLKLREVAQRLVAQVAGTRGDEQPASSA